MKKEIQVVISCYHGELVANKRMTGGVFQFDSSAACTSCSKRNQCDDCASAGCSWCLDTNTCTGKRGTCPDTVINASHCPNCSPNTTCKECTKNHCKWCLDGDRCVAQTDQILCKEGVISSPDYCP